MSNENYDSTKVDETKLGTNNSEAVETKTTTYAQDIYTQGVNNIDEENGDNLQEIGVASSGNGGEINSKYSLLNTQDSESDFENSVDIPDSSTTDGGNGNGNNLPPNNKNNKGLFKDKKVIIGGAVVVCAAVIASMFMGSSSSGETEQVKQDEVEVSAPSLPVLSSEQANQASDVLKANVASDITSDVGLNNSSPDVLPKGEIINNSKPLPDILKETKDIDGLVASGISPIEIEHPTKLNQPQQVKNTSDVNTSASDIEINENVKNQTEDVRSNITNTSNVTNTSNTSNTGNTGNESADNNIDVNSQIKSLHQQANELLAQAKILENSKSLNNFLESLKDKPANEQISLLQNKLIGLNKQLNEAKEQSCVIPKTSKSKVNNKSLGKNKTKNTKLKKKLVGNLNSAGVVEGQLVLKGNNVFTAYNVGDKLPNGSLIKSIIPENNTVVTTAGTYKIKL